MPATQVSSWHVRWLALDDARLLLLEAWCDKLQQLEAQPGWLALSEEARGVSEQASGLSDMDATMRVIDRQLRRWIRAMPARSCDEMGDVVGILRVALRLMAIEEHPVAHRLVSRAIRRMEESNT